MIAFVDAADDRLVAKGYVLTQDNLLDRIEALGLEPFKLYLVPLSEITARTGLGFGSLVQADERQIERVPAAGRGRRRGRESVVSTAGGISEITARQQTPG